MALSQEVKEKLQKRIDELKKFHFENNEDLLEDVDYYFSGGRW